MTDNSRQSSGFAVLIALALLVPVFSGCLEGGDGTGAIYVKDQPEDDWSYVNVTFTEVRVHQAGDDGDEDASEENDSEEDGDDGEWITVAANESGREIDLLGFSGDQSRALLGAEDLEAGTYNQVLITVTEAYGIDADTGEREDFQLTKDELRLTRAWQIEEGNTTHVVADINLDRSIVEQGNGDVRFNPVIGQIIVETNDEEPGDVQDGEADGQDGQGGQDGRP